MELRLREMAKELERFEPIDALALDAGIEALALVRRHRQAREDMARSRNQADHWAAEDRLAGVDSEMRALRAATEPTDELD